MLSPQLLRILRVYWPLANRPPGCSPAIWGSADQKLRCRRLAAWPPRGGAGQAGHRSRAAPQLRHAPATAIYTRVAIKVIAGTPSPLDRLQLSVTPPAWWSSKTFCMLFGAKADFKRCSLKLTISSGVTRAASSYPRNSVSLRHFSAPSAYRSTALRQLLHSLGPNSLGPRTKPRHVLIQRRCRGPRWAHQAGDP
jgi:hypothetical protein